MATNIDTLTIEIQSNSTSASGGIRDLAGALEQLKKSGSVGVAVKNLKSLSDTLRSFTSVSSNANKVVQLATSLEQLKAVGSINIGTSLTKLVTSLKDLSKVRVDNVSPQIQKVVDALAPLSAVKAGGFGTLVSGLARLGKVTQSLDDETIAKFAERIQQLNEVVEPLAQKMTTIQAGLRGVNSTLRQSASSAKSASEEINTSRINFASLAYTIQTVVQSLQAVIEKFSGFISQAIEWDGVAARFGRGFGDQAQETYDWIQRLNEEMGINVQQFMQYSSIYATMLTGFGVAVEDANKMALGYTELTYDIWAGYNDVYKNFSDAADAVKSAIAGEVEPIRRAGFTIVESTLEQTAANHGLSISIYNATEAEKSYLRYLTLVDQAYAQGLVGTYAQELNTAEGLMRTFSQQLKSLAQTFGSLFLPILVKVMPYLQAVVELLTDAVRWLGALFGIDIQPVDWSGYQAGSTAVGDVADAADTATDALGSAAQAAKELKNATIGIDELNVISPPSSTSGSGGTGSTGGSGSGSGFDNLDIDSLWDDSIFADINKQVDNIKKKLEEWLPVIATIGTALGALAIAGLLSSIGEAISKMDLLNKTLATIAVAAIEAVLVFHFADNYLEGGNLLDLVGEALTTAGAGYILFKGFGGAAGKGFQGAALAMFISVGAQLAAITMNLADGGVDMDDPELWIQTAFTVLTGAAGGLFAFKGIGKIGAGKGALIGAGFTLALSLAAITIGDIADNGTVEFRNIMTGALSTLIGGATAAGLFTLLGIASGGTGFLIGAGIMLAINIIGASIAANSISKADIEAELEERFGKIELDTAQLEFVVEKITAFPREITIDKDVWNEALEAYESQTMTVTVDAALDVFVEENKALQDLRSGISSIQKQLDSQNIRIALGMDVDYEDYKSTIDTYISRAQEYLDQHYVTTSLAISILGTDTSDALSSSLATFYTVNSAKLSKLGDDLQAAVSAAFVDGEWIPNKLQEALEIQQEMQEILDMVADYEYRATMSNLELGLSGSALTPESFKNALQGAVDAAAANITALEDAKMSALVQAEIQLDLDLADPNKTKEEAYAIYESTKQIIENDFQNGIVDANFGTVNFGLQTIKDAFAAELETAKKEGWFDLSSAIDQAISSGLTYKFDNGDGEIYANMTYLTSSILGSYEMAVEKISPEVRATMESLLDEMKPAMADYESIAAANQKVGTTVPASVRTGLSDYNQLKALTGDVDAIQYMIGEQLSTDAAYLNTLATAKNAGISVDKNLAQGLYNSMEVVRDEATGVVTGLRNAVTGEVTAVTPTMVENFKQMGIDLTAGLKTGADSEMQTQKKSWKDWAIWPWNWFKEENEINSPSKLFERGGNYLVEGLKNGLGITSLKDRLSEMWDTAKSWWTGNTSLGDADLNVNLIKDGWTSIQDWIGNIPAVSQAIRLAKDAWTSVKSWIGDFKSIAQKIGLSKDGWTSVKSWIGEFKSIAQKIGLSKDGWTSVKKWIGEFKSISQKIGLSKDSWTSVKKWIGDLKSISQKIGLSKNGWTSVKNWVGAAPSISAKIKLAKDGWSSIKNWLGDLSYKLKFTLPKIGVNWGTKEVMGFKISYPSSFYTYAKGGFPDVGEMFIAREAGPEMVGRIGSHSAVANNEQIVEAISEGVYAAVTAAMGASNSGGDGQAINVYLDGRQITASVEKRQKERGASIMGNQVYNYSY